VTIDKEAKKGNKMHARGHKIHSPVLVVCDDKTKIKLLERFILWNNISNFYFFLHTINIFRKPYHHLIHFIMPAIMILGCLTRMPPFSPSLTIIFL